MSHPKQKLEPVAQEAPMNFGNWVPTPEEAAIIDAKAAEVERLGRECELKSEMAADWMNHRHDWASNMMGWVRPAAGAEEDEEIRNMKSWF